MMTRTKNPKPRDGLSDPHPASRPRYSGGGLGRGAQPRDFIRANPLPTLPRSTVGGNQIAPARDSYRAATIRLDHIHRTSFPVGSCIDEAVAWSADCSMHVSQRRHSCRRAEVVTLAITDRSLVLPT